MKGDQLDHLYRVADQIVSHIEGAAAAGSTGIGMIASSDIEAIMKEYLEVAYDHEECLHMVTTKVIQTCIENLFMEKAVSPVADRLFVMARLHSVTEIMDCISVRDMANNPSSLTIPKPGKGKT